MPETVRFIGLDFHPLTLEATADAVTRHGRSGAGFGYVVTPNVDHLVRLEAEPALMPLYRHAWLTVCDSRILEVFSRLDGTPLPACPGADLVAHLFETVIRPDEDIVVIGGDQFVIDRMRSLYGLNRLHWHDAPMGLRKNPAAVAEAAAFVADHPSSFVFLCVGSPQQEMVAKAIADRGDCVGVGLCCGASLDFLAGKTARAPAWMRKARLEWLHRLGSEPRRMWRRYVVEGPKIFRIWRQTRR